MGFVLLGLYVDQTTSKTKGREDGRQYMLLHCADSQRIVGHWNGWGGVGGGGGGQKEGEGLGGGGGLGVLLDGCFRAGGSSPARLWLT